MTAPYLGIEIGGTKLQVVLGDASGRIVSRQKYAVEPAKGAEGIREQLEIGIRELSSRNNFSAVGVGFGGPVDHQSGRICRSHQIEGWSGFDLGRWLKELTKARIIVENDANVAAFGEALCGAGRGHNPVFYITLGSGVGGGLVVDEKIYHGVLPGEAEIGHVRLDRAGTTLESRCSGWAVNRRIIEGIEANPAGELARLCIESPGAEARHLGPSLEKGDELAEKILGEVAADIAFGLSHVVHLFHPEIIILGGGLAKIGEPLRAAVAKRLKEQVMEVFVPALNVTLAELKEDAVPIGALELCRASQIRNGRDNLPL